MVPFLAVAAAAGAIDVEDDFFPLFPSTPLDPLELEVMAPPLKVVRSGLYSVWFWQNKHIDAWWAN